MKLRNWLRRKRNFYIYSVATFGTGTWAILVWQLGPFDGVLWLVWVAVVAFAAAILWAFAMWHLFVAPLLGRLGDGSNDT